jgi:hypothetical protein
MDRRQSLGLLGCLIATCTWAKQSSATVARAVSLRGLVERSTRVTRATPLDSFARVEHLAGSRHIVTYSRLRVDEPILGASTDSELLVRTLGGQVGDLGELVHGEASLALNEPCVVFLRQSAEGIDQVTEMAQGHFPMAMDAAGAPRLFASRNMPRLVGGSASAVGQLSGLRFSEARDLILKAGR